MRTVTIRSKHDSTPFFCTTDQLMLADRVRVLGENDPFNTAIVAKITDTDVHFYRPYGTTSDFSYTGGVLCYVGIEEFCRPLSDKAVWLVVEQVTVK